jgi:ankyrin repeat protein
VRSALLHSYHRQTALHLCADQQATVEQLLELGAECDAADDKGLTPLHTACAKECGCGSLSVEFLLNAGVKVQRYKHTVDHSSSSTSSSDADEHLQGGGQPLHFDALNHVNYRYEHMLGELTSLRLTDVHIDTLTLNGCTPLWLLVRCHAEQDRFACERLEELCDEEGASLHVRTPEGWSLLHAAAAAAAGGTTMLQLLLDRGLVFGDEVYYDNAYDSDADDNDIYDAWRTNSGATVLHCAARGGHAAMVKLLLAQQCDAFATDTAGHTALHYCLQAPVSTAVTECFELLIDAGCDPLATVNTTG